MNRVLILCLLTSIFIGTSAQGQQYKLRQSTAVMGMKSESTIYVKGMRKRTEASAMMAGMSMPPITIEQCDLQRTIKLNDKKKLYFIEPFAKEPEIIDEDVKPSTSVKTKPVTTTASSKTGGTIHMWYTITDTGERKKMSGFTARHVWTYQKIKPSTDACMMKDSMIIKTDGWYIDLPQFNCPVRYAATTSYSPTPQKQPECKDEFVTHRSGKGKLGFPLTETRTMIMGGGGSKTTEFTTSLETIEFSTLKLDSMLFEIPPGYTQTTNEADLQDKMDMKEMMNQYKNQGNNNNPILNEQKKEGMIRIGVFEPKADGQVQTQALQQSMVSTITGGSIEAIAIASEEDAKKYNCNYTLTTDITKIKSGSKVGGLLKAIKKTDPGAASSFNIDATLILKAVADGSIKNQQTVSDKYDGKVDEAARKALDEGGHKVIKGLK